MRLDGRGERVGVVAVVPRVPQIEDAVVNALAEAIKPNAENADGGAYLATLKLSDNPCNDEPVQAILRERKIARKAGKSQGECGVM